ncbi:hypothetical protein [Chryseobacterium sediminis]|uniref:hypothetical protein n=1 Tax=Chryseobacterium sediminis TaxID=1679494 RepID=UPI002858FC70|nr:hypothetical protein [Chryseobacterium sediminis]MDR6463353.1 hypothetical protein [Chryseobacterium sediminis]
MDVKNTSEFVKIIKSELKETDLETLELIDFGKIRNESAPYGDFLVLQAPGYDAKKNNIEKIKPRISEFELILDNSKNADCEEEIETDFGLFLCGAKDRIPYDKQKQ